jgi:membrane protein implicated in regulation of membrane protease activity
VFFAIWCIPAVAASVGVIMRDPVTFTIGLICFVIAGVVLALEHRGSRRPARGRKTGSTAAKKRSPDESAKRRLLER